MNFLSFIAQIKIIPHSFWIDLISQILQILDFIFCLLIIFLPMNDILIFSNYEEVIITEGFLLVYQAWARIWPVMLIIHFPGKLQIKLPHCQPGFQTKYQNYNWLVRASNPSFSCSMCSGHIANITWKTCEQVFLVPDTN